MFGARQPPGPLRRLRCRRRVLSGCSIGGAWIAVAPHTGTLISAPSVHSPRNSNPIAAPQRPPECPHAPPHTPAYAARGTQRYEAGATEINVATTPPTMAVQVPPGEPDAVRAAHPTRATVQAQSAECELHPHSDPSNTTSTTGAAMTESQDSATS